MKRDRRKLVRAIIFSVSATLCLTFGVKQLAQTTQTPQKLPTPTGHVNDFAGVVDQQTKQQLENILAAVKLKTGIEFDIATVESAGGQDISDFSLQLAKDWDVGSRTSAKKSLLLVVAVNEKTWFTRFSRSVQGDLPEGLLGDMGQRMRTPFETGNFNQGLNAAVDYFVSAIADKRGLNAAELTGATTPSEISAAAPTPAEVATPEPNKATDEPAPVVLTAPVATRPARVTRRDPVRVKEATTNRPYVVDDEAEQEEVELTLTLPAEARVAKLRALLDSRPESKWRPRATELLVSSRAALGDEKLKNGDSAGGVEQLLQAIADAPANSSERLYSGVISQVPLNLYLRGETAAATKAAQEIETKFGSDPKRLVTLVNFYVRTEKGSEAVRLASKAVELAPDLAEAHQALGSALHISLRLDEAAREFKRATELDPNSKLARRGLADLSRALGKPDEALALYRQQLEADPADRAARTGEILSLLDLGRLQEGKAQLEKTLQADPRNVTLLAGAAYWFAAHNDNEMALKWGEQALQIEPRYTWTQVAVARALLAQQKPLEAERSIRYARQFGRFPTLDYELASTLVGAALYDEAAEVLLQSFSLKDGQIETRLGGQATVSSENFIELLARERQASIFQPAAADTEANAKRIKALLKFTAAISQETVNEETAVAAGRAFASGDDQARVFRQLYVAGKLLRRDVGYKAAYELSESARESVDAGMSVPELTVAVQADELRSIRARAIAAGATPSIPEAPRNVLNNLLRGRIEDTAGWALFNRDELDKAADHLKRAVAILPEGTPAAVSAMWRLGATLERQDKKSEALSYYIKSYNLTDPDPARRTVIEKLYRQINGSLDGLNERIGATVNVDGVTPLATEVTTEKPIPTQPEATASPALSPAPETQPVAEPAATPASTPTETPTATPETSAPETSPAATPEVSPEPVSEPSPTASPTESTPATSPTPESQPTPTPESQASPPASPSLSASPVEKIDKPRPRATITIVGQVKDPKGAPMADVVVVLISPQGTVLASTTDDQGKFSFRVVPSSTARSYRIIPSKEGYAFEPVDRVLPVLNDDLRELDFVAKPEAGRMD